MDKRFSILPRERRRLTSSERAARRIERRRKTLQVLPSLFTMGNAVCGFAAIVHVAAIQIDPLTLAMKNPENLAHAGWLLILAMLFDALDGRIARMAKATGDFGAELDSLCDAVSFGVAPALMVTMTNSRVLAGAVGSPLWWRFAWLAGLVYVCGAILRLARFNVETESHDESAHTHFKGLPSPAAAGTIASLAILQGYLRGENELGFIAAATLERIANGISYALPVVALAAGWLMVSTVRYVHFGNRFLRGRRTMRGLARLVIGSLLVFALIPEIALTVCFLGFAVSGLVGHVARAARGDGATRGAAEAAAPGAEASATDAPGADDAPPAPKDGAPPALGGDAAAGSSDARGPGGAARGHGAGAAAAQGGGAAAAAEREAVG